MLGSGGEGLFVYYYVHLQRALGDVEPRLRTFFTRFNAWAEAAYREGEELRATIGVGAGGSLVAKTVRMRVGEPSREQSQTRVPIVWEATGPTALFPKMEGALEVASLGPDLTQLAFRGSYDPPLGAVGRALDRVLLHRVAESSVKGFVDRIGEALEAN